MRFGDSIVRVQKKNTRSKISVKMSDDGSNKGGNDVVIVGTNTGKGDGFVGDLYEDNVNIICKMHADEVVDDVNANVDMCFDIDMTDNVKIHVNNVADNVKARDKNALQSVDNVQTSFNKNVNCKNDELLNKEMRSAKGECSDSGSRNDVWNKKFADIFFDNKLDNKLHEIPTEMGKNSNEFVVFNEEVLEVGMDEVVNNGPWMVNNKPLFVQKWRVGMCLDRAEPSKLSAWVKLLHVPMEAWSLKWISALSSSLDKPIIMDDMTTKMCLRGESRIRFARVLVELDAGKMIKDKIDVMYKGDAFHENFTKTIEVEYAWKPPCCTHCKVFGHEEKICKLNKKDKLEERIANGNETVDNDFKVVQNRKVRNDRNDNNNRWTRNNRMNGYQRNIGTQVKIPDNNMNNSVEYRKKKEEVKEKVSVKEQVNKETNQAECNKNGNIELEKNYNGEGIFENKKVGQNEKGDSTKTMSKNEIGLRKIDASDNDMNGWNEEMKRYYKDIKELFHVAAELERDEDIIDGDSKVEEYVIRNEFQECNADIEVGDILSVGFHFTWTKSLRNPNCRTLKKLDRIMINEAFLEKFPQAHSLFLPYVISDHSLVVLHFPNVMPKCRKAFRFSNSITEKKEFLPNVKEEWEKDIEGYMMYRVAKKMNLLKPKLNQLRWKNGNKAIIEWLKDGDRNIKYLHKIIKGRLHKGRIMYVFNEKRESVVFPNKLTNEEAIDMVKPVSEAKVKNAMFDIEDSKAPGLDGFTARSAWSISIVGKEVCKAIQEFFETWKLLRKTIKKYLDEFSGYSGLKENLQKSTIFFRGMSSILTIVPFQIGKLPVRYLGVPLITKNISTDCKPLVEKVRSKVRDWRNKALTYLGRLQLIASILSSMQIYWASIFLLPKFVIYEINKMLKGFLWCQGELTKGNAKVSWDNICKHKDQGGLGLKNLYVWNEVLLVKHLWNVAAKKDTLWVRWINVKILKGRSIWEISTKSNSSMGWKNILRLREKERKCVMWKLKNSTTVNEWWSWPNCWNTKYPILKQCLVPNLVNERKDETVWVNNMGKETKFGIKQRGKTCAAMSQK
ncbi:RNA-directed DNA polymerase, eukaryota, reverse transcriptase zinc-binding domain protein [Tanacetum coccineum]|uniref:RNA-directed DNA polymerase, eukaryota, reverse transcriptase zinc-binding domain protein n=1 Tax=Tanacetum coccineum TaxID=301880 RepID=A0ABQ5ADH7_9ASTR